MKIRSFLTVFSLALGQSASGQALVGQDLADPLGFTMAPRAEPLQNLSEFDYNQREGEVILVMYHASW